VAVAVDDDVRPDPREPGAALDGVAVRGGVRAQPQLDREVVAADVDGRAGCIAGRIVDAYEHAVVVGPAVAEGPVDSPPSSVVAKVAEPVVVLASVVAGASSPGALLPSSSGADEGPASALESVVEASELPDPPPQDSANGSTASRRVQADVTRSS
jgi:hypothetical protein